MCWILSLPWDKDFQFTATWNAVGITKDLLEQFFSCLLVALTSPMT